MVRHPLAGIVLLAGALAATRAPLAQDGDLVLEATLEPSRVPVQTQATYRLRFYQAVDVRALQITGPAVRLADIHPLGERSFEAVRDGRRYRVHESSYAVFPFASGSLELKGAYATGRVIALAAPDAPDGRKAVRLVAAPQTLTVLPVPDAESAATSVAMSESWQAPDRAVAGEAWRRTIRIEASGMRAESIPAVQVEAPGMSVHTGAPRFENRVVNERNVGTREQTFTMVALKAGDISVPEVRLRWWNAGTDAVAGAVLPGRVLRVAGADGALAALDSPVPRPASWRFPSPAWLSAALAAVAAALAIWRRRAALRARWRIFRHCRRGDARAVRDELLRQSALVWPDAPPLTLPALAQRLPDGAARRVLEEMDRSLYGPGARGAAPPSRALRQVMRAMNCRR